MSQLLSGLLSCLGLRFRAQGRLRLCVARRLCDRNGLISIPHLVRLASVLGFPLLLLAVGMRFWEGVRFLWLSGAIVCEIMTSTGILAGIPQAAGLHIFTAMQGQ